MTKAGDRRISDSRLGNPAPLFAGAPVGDGAPARTPWAVTCCNCGTSYDLLVSREGLASILRKNPQESDVVLDSISCIGCLGRIPVTPPMVVPKDGGPVSTKKFRAAEQIGRIMRGEAP